MTAVDATSVATSGLGSDYAAARARVAELQQAFGTPSSTTTGTASSSDFASVLAGVQAGQSATAPGVAASGTGSAKGQQVVAQAEKYLGTPYVYGSNDPSHGLDCSGLVQVAYRQMGVELPRVTYDQVKVGQPVDRANLQPGDLVFSVGDKGMRVNGHVGIYAGNGQYVVAPHTGDVVKLAPLPKNITAIRRIFPADGSTNGGS